MSSLDRMIQPMLHEDFYSFGKYTNHTLGIFSGFVSPHANCNPSLVWSETGNVGCFISGDAFIGGPERDKLESHSQQSPNETALALVNLYEDVGLEALKELNGCFSGLLVDVLHRRVILFNDRYGLNRIYIHEQNGRVFFSSQAKSLLAVVRALRALDPQGLAEWVSCGCVLGNRSLFRGICLLAPGSAWVFSADGNVKKETYFSASTWENQSALSPEDYYEQLTRVFPRILKHYTGGPQPVAMSLTGGLDGRMIMAWARPDDGRMPCYTFNGSYRDCADVRIARRVAAACGQQHHTISVGDEFLAQFPQLAEQTVRIADGAMDVTGAVELYVNRLARQIAPVRLTGNYGSEILRKHIAFRPRALSPEIFSTEFVPQLAAAAHTYSEEAMGNRLSFIAFKQVPWHHYARFAVEQSQIALRSPFLDNDLVALAFQAPHDAVTGVSPILRLIAQGNPALGRIRTDRGMCYPANQITNRARRALEEFLAKAEFAYDYGMPNWLARIDKFLMLFRLERLFLGRQKFCHFRIWYRDRLAPYIREVLLDPRSLSRPYLQKRKLEHMVAHHVGGKGNFTTELHKLLTLELTQRLLLEGA
jgi:asparagine synthase (glutamine-hydrolysing)